MSLPAYEPHDHVNITIDKTSPDSLKRRRDREGDNDEGISPLPQPFTVSPFTTASVSLSSDRQYVVTPKLAIARSHLPLSLAERYCNSQSRHFFRSDKVDLQRVLEQDLIVVAILEDSPWLYLLETCGPHTYALTSLANNVKLKHLEHMAKQSLHRASKAARVDPSLAQDWWTPAVLSTRLTQTQTNDTIRPYDSIEASETSLLLETTGGSTSTQPRNETEAADDEAASSLAHAYLETLYLSKASLAYFVKGPLTRARTGLGTDYQTETNNALKEILETMVLSVGTFDKKHKDKIPEKMKNILAQTASGVQKQRRPNKATRYRLGKNGLYGAEDSFLSQWWSTEEAEHLHTGYEEQLKQSSLRLRFRESLLQIIVVLETLALCKSQKADQSREEPFEDTAINEESHLAGQSVERQSKKPKKSEQKDPRNILEALIDRLCIWQSLTTDVSSTLDDSSGSDNARQPQGVSKDELKDFCSAVVIPFYGSRLGTEVRSICRKFGVTRTRSPSKIAMENAEKRRKGRSSTDKKTDTKVRDEDSRKAKTRVASLGSKHPTLTRAATDSVLQKSSKGRSEASSIFQMLQKEREPLTRTNSITSQARPSTSREVDINAITKYNESKARTKPNVEQELKDAIATLKKPNRSLAVKEYVDSTDSRRPQVKKRPSNRGAMSQQIQIGATPRKDVKQADVVDHQDSRMMLPSETPLKEAEEAVPPSSMAVATSSALRPAQEDLHGASYYTRSLLETPSRGPTKFARSTFLTIPDSARRPLVRNLPSFESDVSLVTPSKNTTKEYRLRDAHLQEDVAFDTPFQQSKVREPSRENMPTITMTPITAKMTPMNITKNIDWGNNSFSARSATSNDAESLYKTLGWDENDMDELL